MCIRDRARFDEKWTAEALYNLVDNALKYTPQGGKVALSVREFELFCAIQVEDDGPGIPEGCLLYTSSSTIKLFLSFGSFL